MKPVSRLKARQLKWRARDYLVYRALWPALETGVRAALAAQSHVARPVVLDVGCGERPYRDLFENTRYIGINYGLEGASPDVAADAQALPIAAESVDVVFSTQVIEHLPHPERMLREAWRVLRPNGSLILSGPFYWPLHEEPYDFFRFTKYGFERLVAEAGFGDIRVENDCGAVTQVAVSLIEILPRPLSPLIPIINLCTPWLQRRSRNTKSTLNYIVSGRKR
jgi:SAM-dependent methyltransferase